MLARLGPYAGRIAEYRYTDLSHAFLRHAQAVYGPDHPYLSCGIFDVEKPIAGQAVDADGYDLVIAANVLHATRNIRRTLRNAKATLRTNGVLLLNEMSGSSLFTHLTFGLLEGWWLYEDETLRIPGCPALSRTPGARSWTRKASVRSLSPGGSACTWAADHRCRERRGGSTTACRSEGRAEDGRRTQGASR